MSKSYKEQLADYKMERKDPQQVRAKPKAKKPKPFKVYGTITFTGRAVRFCVGNYAKLKDAKNAVERYKRSPFYTDITLETIDGETICID